MPNENVPICGCGVAMDLPGKNSTRNVVGGGNLIPNKKYGGVTNCSTIKTTAVAVAATTTTTTINCNSSKFDNHHNLRERKNNGSRSIEEDSIIGGQQGSATTTITGNSTASSAAAAANIVAVDNNAATQLMLQSAGSTSSVQTQQQQSEHHRHHHHHHQQSTNTRINDKKYHANKQQGRRLNSARRTRSAERPDSHYTYIDSGSSIVGNGIRENVIPEGLYASVNGSPNRTANPHSSLGNNQPTTNNYNGHNHHSQQVYAIPSMTSPPPTYDVAMWQSGLPPSYEEYLCHKYAVISRSHTPPPPWSDSNTLVTNGQNQIQSRRDILTSQPDIREYLNQLAKSHAQSQSQQSQQSQNNNQTTNSSRQQQQQQQQQHLRITRDSNNSSGSNASISMQNTNSSQISRDHQVAVRSQRARATISRSQSESRARQQRIATMYEDGAFCMETTVIQSAFEHGVAFCSLM